MYILWSTYNVFVYLIYFRSLIAESNSTIFGTYMVQRRHQNFQWIHNFLLVSNTYARELLRRFKVCLTANHLHQSAKPMCSLGIANPNPFS